MINSAIIKKASLRLLEPYTIPPDCPYLSEDQQELSTLTMEKRSEWMGEWLQLAAVTSKAVNPIPVMSFEDVELKFRKLVTTYRTRALWFLHHERAVEITSPTTNAVLNHIAEKCTRADWVEVKKIQQWLLQNSR